MDGESYTSEVKFGELVLDAMHGRQDTAAFFAPRGKVECHF